MPQSIVVELKLGEAVELVTAWVAEVARLHDIRVLVIKGDAMARQGLREPRVAGDVDVLVDPRRFDEYCVAIERGGWDPRQQTLIGAEWSPHSTSFLRPGWPCDIDVHRFYPGLLADEQQAFDALWDSRQTMRFAHHSVEVPSRPGNAIILALHSLRDGMSQPRHRGELSGLLDVNFRNDELADLVALARETGALGPLSDVLPKLGVATEELPFVADSIELRAWRARVAADSSGAYFWLVMLGREPWRRRPRILARALWPTRRDLLIAHPGMDDSAAARVRARIARIPAGVRSLPTALRAFTR